MATNISTSSFDNELLMSFAGCNPVQSGRLFLTSRFQDTWHIQAPMRILAVSSGICTVSRQGEEKVLYQNDIYFMFQGGRYTLIHGDTTSSEIFWVEAGGPGIASFLAQLPLSPASSVIRGISNQGLLHEMKQLSIFSGAMTPGDSLKTLGSLYRLLSILADEGSDTAWSSVPYDSPEILYTGVWTRWPSRESKHNEIYTATRRSYAEFNFYGTGIRWYGTLNFDCGKADVLIDGIYQTTVDSYNETRLPKQLLFSKTDLPPGHHIIKVFCTGESNPRAVNCDVVVEGFHFLSSLEDLSTENRPLSSSIIQDAVRLIREDLASDLSVSRLAAKLNVSRSYLSSRFSAEMGLTLTQYIINLRMTQAKRLLITTDHPIARIAALVGFRDAYYFSRFFKKNARMAPTKYRKTHTRDGAHLREIARS